MGSESDCLLGQLERISEISDSYACLKVEKSGGEDGGEGECGDDTVEREDRERRSFEILSVKKEANLLASKMGEVEVSKAAERSRRQIQDILCKPIALIRQL